MLKFLLTRAKRIHRWWHRQYELRRLNRRWFISSSNQWGYICSYHSKGRILQISGSFRPKQDSTIHEEVERQEDKCQDQKGICEEEWWEWIWWWSDQNISDRARALDHVKVFKWIHKIFRTLKTEDGKAT